MNYYGFDGFLVVLFVVLHGGFHGGADFRSFVAEFVVVLVVVFGGAAHGG